ncbi:MAG: response regulator transcription factor [Acidimicrobiales bacterium]
MTITVLIADDQTLVRGAFSVLVNSANDLTVVGEASSGKEAVELAALTCPDVILMDIRMPDLDGIEATRQILSTRGSVGTRVLILTTFDLDEYVYRALRAGASGFLLKDTPPAQLLEAIRVIAAGDALLSPRITRTLIAEFTRRHPVADTSPDAISRLTSREVEVLRLVGKGRSNAEIAADLHMSVATAKTHVSRVLTKLERRDRAQLVVFAYESGLTNSEEA